MHWFLKKGSDLSTTTESHARYALCLHLWPHESRQFTLNLFATDGDEAPHLSYEQVCADEKTAF